MMRKPVDQQVAAVAERARTDPRDEQVMGNTGIPAEVRADHPAGAMISEVDVTFPPDRLAEMPVKKMRRAGQVGGDYPDVAFDPEKRQAFHLDDSGERVFHETPAGFRYTKDGVLEAKAD